MAFRAFRPTHLRQMAAKMTEAERSEALREANAKMREYHMKRPPIEKVRRKKRKSEDHTIQMAIAASFATVFLATPFLGQKIVREWCCLRRICPALLLRLKVLSAISRHQKKKQEVLKIVKL